MPFGDGFCICQVVSLLGVSRHRHNQHQAPVVQCAVCTVSGNELPVPVVCVSPAVPSDAAVISQEEVMVTTLY